MAELSKACCKQQVGPPYWNTAPAVSLCHFWEEINVKCKSAPCLCCKLTRVAVIFRSPHSVAADSSCGDLSVTSQRCGWLELRWSFGHLTALRLRSSHRDSWIETFTEKPKRVCLSISSLSVCGPSVCLNTTKLQCVEQDPESYYAHTHTNTQHTHTCKSVVTPLNATTRNYHRLKQPYRSTLPQPRRWCTAEVQWEQKCCSEYQPWPQNRQTEPHHHPCLPQASENCSSMAIKNCVPFSGSVHEECKCTSAGYTYIHTHIHTYTHTFRALHLKSASAQPWATHTYVHTYTHTYTYIHMSRHCTWRVQVYSCALHIHAYIHTYTRSGTVPEECKCTALGYTYDSDWSLPCLDINEWWVLIYMYICVHVYATVYVYM